MVAEGSVYFETESHIEVGDLIKPPDLSIVPDAFNISCEVNFTKSAAMATTTLTTDINSSTIAEVSEQTNLRDKQMDILERETNIFEQESVNGSDTSLLGTTKSSTSSTIIDPKEYQELPELERIEDKLAKDNWDKKKYYPMRHDSYYMLTITKLTKEDEGHYFCHYYCKECDSRKSELIFTGKQLFFVWWLSSIMHLIT